jgi:hypothetical protein
MSLELLYDNETAPQNNLDVSNSLIGEAGMVGMISPNELNGDPEIVLYTSGVKANNLVGLISQGKDSSYSSTVINEVTMSGQTVLPHADIIAKNNNVLLSAFGAGGSGTVTLITKTNAQIQVDGVDPNDTSFKVSYSFVIPGKGGDDTTLAAGKCTLWLQEGEYQTDVFELSEETLSSDYYIGAPLYSADDKYGQKGRLTVRDLSVSWGSARVGYVVHPPTSAQPRLRFYKSPI